MKITYFVCTFLFSFSMLHALCGKDEGLENEVRDFISKAAESDHGIVDYYNREKSHKILTTSRDWESVLSRMLDIHAYSEAEVETVLATIAYRKSSHDPRIRKALSALIEQLYAAAAKSAANAREGIVEPPPKNPFQNTKQRFATYATTLARLENPSLLLDLIAYASSKREDELLAFKDPAYANIFVAAGVVGTEDHINPLKELLPKLRQRGILEKTIELGEKALRDIETAKRPGEGKTGSDDENQSATSEGKEPKDKQPVADGSKQEVSHTGTVALVAGGLAVVILIFVLINRKTKSGR